MFHDSGGYWRDLLCLSSTVRSLNGRHEIAEFLRSQGTAAVLRDVSIEGGDGSWVPQHFQPFPSLPTTREGVLSSFRFTLSNPAAVGRGLVRLIKAEDGSWKVATLLTKLVDFVGHEEVPGYRPPTSGGDAELQTFQGRMAAKQNAILKQLDVLIGVDLVAVGAGQSGVMLAARLWQNGLNALVVDKFPRVGDSWRTRYPSLALHSGIGDFMEYYATSQEICVWGSSCLDGHPTFDAATEKWSVNVNRGGHIVTLNPSHLVMATGATGRPSLPRVDGLSKFTGTWYHAHDHEGAAPHKGKRVIIVGAGNTGADLAVDFARHGAASIVMVQRDSTAIMKRDTAKALLFDQAFPDSRSVSESDFAGESMSLGFQNRISASGGTAFMKQLDADMFARLEAAGYKTNQGEQFGKGEIGVFGVLGERYRGIYLDVGCVQLITDGTVRIKQGVTVTAAEEHGLIYSDGSKEPADVLVFATGYEAPNESMHHLLGADIARQLGPIWGTNGEGELQGSYLPHPHPNLWMAMGGISQTRVYTKYLVSKPDAVLVLRLSVLQALQLVAWKHNLRKSSRS
ncbi:FAD/NAD(P)-binding domain-containing protein [Auricularia subglabra TFB-10046 SS5]|nr:FAD/NAD(P)-binding domain-containing protein [Auricularia subglabra TFB-10046 SS5]